MCLSPTDGTGSRLGSGPALKSASKPKGSSMVRQGFLKKSVSFSASAPVLSDSRFAFAGFPLSADPREVVDVVTGFVQDILGDFDLAVIGTAAVDGGIQVGVQFAAADCDALEKRVFDMRDRFTFRDAFLTTVQPCASNGRTF